MRILITFLGSSNQPIDIWYSDQIFSGTSLTEALTRSSEFDRIYIFGDDEGLRAVLPGLQGMDEGHIQALSIPAGDTSEEMWMIFTAVINVVQEREAVVFDLTRARRAIPFLALLAAAFLKGTRQATIDRILYAPDEPRPDGRPPPVSDLTGFVAVLDWLGATERFTQAGDGEPLAELLRTRPLPGPGARPEPRPAVSQQLIELAARIRGVSRALHLSRPIETMKAAARLTESLQQAEQAIREKSGPFVILTEQVKRSYAPFAEAAPLREDRLPHNLRLQLVMIRRYLDENQVMQAATLTREWLVSLALWQVGMTGRKLGDFRERQEMSQALHLAERRLRSGEAGGSSRYDRAVQDMPDTVRPMLLRVWRQVSLLRNDLDHTDWDRRGQSAATLAGSMRTMFPALEELAGRLLGEEPPGTEV